MPRHGAGEDRDWQSGRGRTVPDFFQPIYCKIVFCSFYSTHCKDPFGATLETEWSSCRRADGPHVPLLILCSRLFSRSPHCPVFDNKTPFKLVTQDDLCVPSTYLPALTSAHSPLLHIPI